MQMGATAGSQKLFEPCMQLWELTFLQLAFCYHLCSTHAIVEIGLFTAGFLLSSVHLCIGDHSTFVFLLHFILCVFCSLT